MTCFCGWAGIHFAASSQVSGKIQTEIFANQYIMPFRKRRLEDKDALNELFSTLVQKRDKLAQNAGFSNYRDYKFKELGRFDYTKEDCFQFHEAVKLHVLPLVNAINKKKKEKLGLDSLRPWDTEAEPAGVTPLNPFKTGKELLDKSVAVFEQLRPFFADCLRKMDELKHFDLESRKGKSTGRIQLSTCRKWRSFHFYECSWSDARCYYHGA